MNTQLRGVNIGPGWYVSTLTIWICPPPYHIPGLWWEPPPPPFLFVTMVGPYLNWVSSNNSLVPWIELLSHGPVISDWFSPIVIFINFKISLLQLPTRKSKAGSYFRLSLCHFLVKSLGSLKLISNSHLSSSATRQLVQPLVWLSREPSDLSGLQPVSPPWLKLEKIQPLSSHRITSPASRLAIRRTI
jgi:hypothetical protein